MTVLFPVLLSIYLLNFSKGQTLIKEAPSDSVLSSSALQYQTPPESPKTRHLETYATTTCNLPHCKSCDFSNKTCKHCLSGYKLNKGVCDSGRQNSSSSMDLVSLIILIVSLIIFSVIFCALCIYFARKQKPRYSGHQNTQDDLTKSASIITDYLSEEVQSPSTLLHPSENENSFRSADSNLRARRLRLRQVYKSIPTLDKSKKVDGECSICFEILAGFDLKQLNCQHLLHRSCCREWMKMGKENCPSCGVEIK